MVLRGQPWTALEVSCTWLRHLLVHHAIQFLPGIEVIMTMEQSSHTIVHQKLMDRETPPGSLQAEDICPVQVPATGFEIRSSLDPAAHLSVKSAHQVMNEDEFEGRRT